MYLSPYSHHDDELVKLLAECVDELLSETQKDYLINILTDPKNKNLTLKAMLEKEVKAKHDFDKQLAKMGGK